jgi:2-amino-4-hydroxy-6-hydroxymethyldihydropteridine diphosphokinase
VPVYVGLGSNLNDPEAQVRRALAALATLPENRLVAVSGLYRNPPVGPPGQPEYVNAVAGLLTHDEPVELLGRLRAIEAAQGRRRDAASRWGPRTIDLDLLVFGSRQINSPELVIPHPGIQERNFVLLPLAEIAPALNIPGLGGVRQLASRLDSASLKKLDPQ